MGKSLVACLGVGKGTWGHVNRLISQESFDRVILISSEFGKENFKPEKPVEWVFVNTRAGFEIIKDAIKNKLPDGELAVSLVAGSGKEHMALLVALKESSREYQIVSLTGQGTKYY